VSSPFLLTGATGFVGRQILGALAARAAAVRPVVRPGSQEKLVCPQAIESVVVTPDLFAEGANWASHICEDIDTVVHAAWFAEPGVYLHAAENDRCLAGTLELARGAAKAGIRRFVGIGTCLEYGLGNHPLSVQAPLRPTTAYARAKAAAFTALSHMLPEHGVEFAWCRLFYLHGEGSDERRLIAYLRARLAAGEPAILSSGRQVRDYLDVREAGEMVAEIATGHTQGAVNICSGVPTTVQELAERIADEYGRRDLLHFGARPDDPFDPPYIVGIPSLTRP